jgi:UTP--glucose-1-phosphate uridylyltransferase
VYNNISDDFEAMNKSLARGMLMRESKFDGQDVISSVIRGLVLSQITHKTLLLFPRNGIKMSALPEEILSNLTVSQKELIQKLNSVECGQCHLFDDWASLSPEDHLEIATQLESLDKAYNNGGLAGYITNARKLLEDSKKGVNPLDGWEPHVPVGATFDLGTEQYKSTEAKGLEELGAIGFVLVAGGLGERLGYNGIKLELPTELATETCYLNYYIHYILSVQKKYGKPGTKLPLCIMVSNDTRAGTEKLLKANGNFGMSEGQISIVQQGSGVPALLDNAAKFEMDDSTKMVATKPHGHGDIHELLYTSGVARTWCDDQGIKWICFFQVRFDGISVVWLLSWPGTILKCNRTCLQHSLPCWMTRIPMGLLSIRCHSCLESRRKWA